MAEHETIADVIAWLRRPREGENGYLTLWRDEIAARLEAAHKRENEEWRQKLGDCAKLREALKRIVNERGILDFCHNNLGSKTWGDWDKVYKTLRKWIDEAMSALDTPPRNCDVPEVAKDPWRAWLDDESNWEDGNPKLEIHDWLFAPATEKEGGNDGNE